MRSHRIPALGVGKCSLKSPGTARLALGSPGPAQGPKTSGSHTLGHHRCHSMMWKSQEQSADLRLDLAWAQKEEGRRRAPAGSQREGRVLCLLGRVDWLGGDRG